MSEFIFLDSVWKSLFILTTSTTIILTLSLLSHRLVRQFISNEKSKWFFHLHTLFVIASIVAGTMIVISIDPELAAGCFDHFVSSSNSYSITRLLAGAYLLILTAIMFFDFGKFFIASKKHHLLEEIQDHFLNQILNELTSCLKIDRPISILLNNHSESPYVLGLFNTQIVVTPHLLNSKDIDQIKTILSHELMHIKGKDSVWLLLNHFLKRIFFFNPISYLFFAKHRLVIEMAADERAIEQCGVEPKVLLNSIIEIAEFCTKKQDYLLQVNASQGFIDIKERVQSMLDYNRKKIRWVFPVVSTFSLLLSLTVFAFQAKASVGTLSRNDHVSELMCSQIRHEKVIENWLQIEPAPNKCEMN